MQPTEPVDRRRRSHLFRRRGAGRIEHRTSQVGTAPTRNIRRGHDPERVLGARGERSGLCPEWCAAFEFCSSLVASVSSR